MTYDKDAQMQCVVDTAIQQLHSRPEDIGYLIYHRARLCDQLDYVFRVPDIYRFKSVLVLGETLPWVSFFLWHRLNIEVTLVDIVGGRNWDHINIVPMDLNKPEPLHQTWPLIIACDMLEHLDKPEVACNWMHEHLVVWGMVMLSVPYGEPKNEHDVHHMHYDLDELKVLKWFEEGCWSVLWAERNVYDNRTPVITMCLQKVK